MFWVELIGVVAGCLIYGAMAFKNLVWIKILLLAGSVLFLTYGIILALPAIIIINAIGVLIGILGVRSALKAKNRR